jgi:hypothetical protein
MEEYKLFSLASKLILFLYRKVIAYYIMISSAEKTKESKAERFQSPQLKQGPGHWDQM